MLPQKIRERKKPGEIDLNFFLLLGFIFGSVLWLKTCKIMRFILHDIFGLPAANGTIFVAKSPYFIGE